MAFPKSLCFSTPFFFFIITFISSSHAYTFQVGGNHGWTLPPSENYNNWSSRLRFLVNDTLHFKYDGGSDSVLVVNKTDYDGCNVDNPITKLDGGDSLFKLDRSGPFYFVSGNQSSCDQGQKLKVVVLAVRRRSPPPAAVPPPSPSPLPPSPAVSPILPPPSISISPVSSPSISISPVYPPAISESPESASTGAPTMSPPASSPSGGFADSPGGSDGGGSADSPEPDGDNSKGAGEGAPAPSPAAMPKLSGAVIVLVVTMMMALWGIN